MQNLSMSSIVQNNFDIKPHPNNIGLDMNKYQRRTIMQELQLYSWNKLNSLCKSNKYYSTMHFQSNNNSYHMYKNDRPGEWHEYNNLNIE